MDVQVRNDITNKPLVLDEALSTSKDSLTIAQDGARGSDLVYGTLMAKIAASGKYVPFTDEAATDGTALPVAIYIGPDIPAADLVAGDVVDRKMLLGGSLIVDESQLTIENSKTLETVIGSTSVEAKTVRDALNNRGFFFQSTVDPSEFENA